MLKRLALIAGLALIASSASISHAQQGSVSGSVTPNPLMVFLESVPVPQQAGTGIRLAGSVQNLSTVRASDITLRLRAEPSTVGAQGGFTQTIRQLQPMQDSGFSWRICSNTPANYLVIVTAIWNDGGETFQSESGAALVTVVEGRRSCPNSFVFAEPS